MPAFTTWLFGALVGLMFAAGASACASTADGYDYLIVGGLVYSGDDAPGEQLVVGIRGDRIAYVGPYGRDLVARTTIDAAGLVVAPGFIDPHTHAWDERGREGPIMLTSYATQGITTVISGNDGKGPSDIAAARRELEARGLGINMALLVGHGSVRRQAMGMAARAPTADELAIMRQLVMVAMDEGALGLSTGLFYAPGSFAGIDEVVALARVAAAGGGLYESHIRDESNYTIGLLGAIDEAIEIGTRADIPVHIAHIKALGVDIWGQSAAVIGRIEAARNRGLRVTADQYPWAASGTRISNALVPRWAMAGGRREMLGRLQDPRTRGQILAEMAENLRRRGGPHSILLTGGDQAWRGRYLDDFAQERGQTPLEAANHILKQGDAGIASFNMHEDDIRAFMVQPWIMSSSDGGDGHPRKYASFPRKYRAYVKDEKLLSLQAFIHRSTKLTADTFGLAGRGRLAIGAFADILVFDPDTFSPRATFEAPALLSEGVCFLMVNGQPMIRDGQLEAGHAGKILGRSQPSAR